MGQVHRGSRVLRGPRGPPQNNLSWCEKRWKRAGINGEGLKTVKKPLLIRIVWVVPFSHFNAAEERTITVGLFLFLYKNTNSSDVWSHRECLILGWYPQGLFTAGAQMRWGHNLLLFLVSLKSSPWQWQGFNKMTVTMTPFFKTFCPQNCFCYKSSLTHPKCTKSHLQRSRFQKIFQGEKPPDPRCWGSRFAAGEGEGPGKWSAPGPALALGGPG